MLPLHEVAQRLDLRPDDLWPYGPGLAKLAWSTMQSLRQQPARGRLVLVTAMTPTKHGEGKTTTSIALAQGLARRGVRVAAALREPSLGPVFGAKGGGTGGGQSQLLPSDRINLHCTGDLHAIAAANNLLAALADNAMHQRTAPLQRIVWRRCLDMNDRALREAVIGLGGAHNGPLREGGFDITAASQVMATLCLATGPEDLQARLGRLIVGVDADEQPVTAAQLKAVSGMAALLQDALLPNLVQTTEGVPALVHGGPFANIAHGCSSVLATRAALALADVVVTEAGFGFDLGGEKFLDLKCRSAGIWPSAVVVVATLRALRAHGDGVLAAGYANLNHHLRAIASFGLQPLVAINVFADDTLADLASLEALLSRDGIPSARCEGFARGGSGSEALADVVTTALGAAAVRSPEGPRFAYAPESSCQDKVRSIATQVYGAADVAFTAAADRDIARCNAWGLGQLPVCIAKTHMSLSDDPSRAGAPSGFTLTVRQVRPCPGPDFLLALTGDISTMPGLPKQPAAHRIALSPDGLVTGI